MVHRARAGAAALVALAVGGAACGRVGFDPRSGDGGADVDASPTDSTTIDAGVGTEEPCRLLSPQCGCAASEMCGWDTFTPRACVAIGTPAAGATCGSSYDCAPGAGCLELGNGAGQCMPWCDAPADCAPGASCVRLWWTGAIGVCSTVCDPIMNTGCPAPLACSLGLGTEVPTAQTVVSALCANLGAAGGVDAACSGPLDCQSGLACYGSTCRPVCRMDVAASCAGTCGPFAPRAFIGAVEYGGCI